MSCFSAISNTTWFQLSKIKGFRHGDVIRSLLVTLSLLSPNTRVNCSRDYSDYKQELVLVILQEWGKTVAGVSDRDNVFCGQLLCPL